MFLSEMATGSNGIDYLGACRRWRMFVGLEMADTPTVILGDFNVNLLGVSSKQKALTKCLLQQRRYKQLITRFTTDYHKQIDHIYTNIPNHVLTAGVLESYYSDHKPTFVRA